MTLRKSKEVGKNSEGDQKKKKGTFYLEILLTIDIGLSSDSLLTLHPVYGVTLCQPDIVTCWATHSGLLGSVWKTSRSLSLSRPCLPSPFSPLRAFVDVDSSSPSHHSSCPWQTLEKIKNPAPLISLEGLQIEFSLSQCPLSWLSLGAEAGPWRRPKDQLTEFEMLWS